MDPNPTPGCVITVLDDQGQEHVYRRRTAPDWTEGDARRASHAEAPHLVGGAIDGVPIVAVWVDETTKEGHTFRSVIGPQPPRTPNDPTRLVVTLNRHAQAALDATTLRDDLNKTTAVNRALQVYDYLGTSQAAGYTLTLTHPDNASLTIRFF